jgi:ubiquinone/menaquinone biosynthesis C-methylase UbiE
MNDIARKKLIQEYYSKRASDYDRQKSRTWKSVQGFGDDVFKEILQGLRNFEDKLLLEIGVGSGRNARPLLEKIGPHIVGLDISKEMLKTAGAKLTAHKQSLDLILSDAEHLPLAGETFDAILCMSTTHYFSDQETALRNFGKQLKKNGILIYGDLSPHEADSIGFFETLERTISKAHARYYKASEIKRLIENNGFHTVRVRTIGYEKNYEALIEDKGRYFDVSFETLQKLIQKVNAKTKKQYALTDAGMTLFYTVATAVKQNV